MICVSIQNRDLDGIFGILERGDVEMAEIRLDRCPLDEDDIRELFTNCDKPLLATCRFDECPDAERRLEAAVEAGARFVDLELEAPAPIGKRLRRKARECGTSFIRSYHNYEYTPSAEELGHIVDTCHRFGAEIVKIATKATCSEDISTVGRLYETCPEGSLIAFCMGEEGKDSRTACLKLGAPFSYAALGEKTADGQMQLQDMREAVYGSFKPYIRDSVSVPSSKSIAQRAIIAAAMAEGTSHLHGYTPCEDSEAAISVARELGAVVETGPTLTITGRGDSRTSVSEIDTGESGLLTRLIIPILALDNAGGFGIKGHGTLLRRPLAGAGDIMASFGVMLSNKEHAGREIHVPLSVSGNLIPGRADISGKGGSQLISGLLMALPMAGRNSTLYIHEPKSIPYMFMTADMIRKFGVIVSNEMEGDDEFLETQDWGLCTGMTFRIKGGQKYRAADIDLEADWSSAAPFMVAGAIFGSVQIEGLDTSSLQADISIIDILVEAGACVSQTEGSNTICIQKAPLEAFEMDLSNAPDLFPIVSVLAAFCPGQSRLSGVARLSGKESDRGAAILEMLQQMGVEAFIEKDDLMIAGHSLTYRIMNSQLLHGGMYSSHHDHRMVMALRVAELGADCPVEIDDSICVAKSFPDFSL